MTDPMETEGSRSPQPNTSDIGPGQSNLSVAEQETSESPDGQAASSDGPSSDKQRKKDEKKAAKAAKAARALAKAEGALRHPWQLEREAASAAVAAAVDPAGSEGGGDGEPRRKRRGWKHRLVGQDGEAVRPEPSPETLDPAAPHWRELSRVLDDLQRQAAAADQPPSWALSAAAPGGGRRVAAGPVLASVIKSTLLQARLVPTRANSRKTDTSSAEPCHILYYI
jgi:hypothetical protein